MKRRTFAKLALLVSLTAGFGANADGKEPPHIYLLIGQSNMAGRAPFTEVEAAPIDRCLLLNDKDKWEPATNPLNRFSTIRKGLGMQKMNPRLHVREDHARKGQGHHNRAGRERQGR